MQRGERVAEGLGAGGLVGALAEDLLERGLEVDGVFAAQRQFGRHHAVQDDAAHRVRMLARIFLGHAGAVGAAVEVELRRTDRLAQRLDVAGRDGGGVLAGVGVQAGQAVARHLQLRFLAGRFAGVQAFGHLARQAVGAAGAALVHEDDVALVAKPRKATSHRRVRLGGRLARATGEEDHRVGGGFGGARCHQGHLQADLAAVGLGRVFGHVQRGALGAERGASAGLGQVAVGEFKAAQRACRNGQRRQEQGKGKQSSHGDLGEKTQGVDDYRRRGAENVTARSSCRCFRRLTRWPVLPAAQPPGRRSDAWSRRPCCCPAWPRRP